MARPRGVAKPHQNKLLEPMVGIEPTTYGLQNRCSTTELHRRGGQSWIRTSEGVSQQIYSLSRLTASVSARMEPLTGIEPVTSSLPWMCSTD
ncbi:MAG: hypothetical protein UX09_C0067G0015 [Candidatus Uhrbacteria bacterium GW2011_GWE2_45_35]|uniref:Uncharacterized protein n=1 Tax=Candidatus Uhrbacteria bacterium GW2011_GWE2_45_35 TaxID=1618993 RepID=A0A0G1PJS4_9BACT|nr:MAG: hypothetical protein UX09_C0067G0015 [Candidatus Uhrbacteria bacterium GW2011_GWE2_45_35]